MRLWGTVLATAALSCGAQAQVYQAFYTAIHTAQDNGAIPKPVQENITDIKGFPGLTERDGALPAPVEAEKQGDLKVLQTDTFDRIGDDVFLKGPIEMQYRGYHIFADEGRGNLASEVFTFTGHVKIIGQDGVILGQSVMVEFKIRFFHAVDADTDMKPIVAKGLLLDDVYLKAAESQGTSREVISQNALATTCNYESPHYEILAGRSDIRPYKRAIFHDVDLVILHHKVLHVPFLSVPLNEPNYSYIPQFGHNAVEGYFMRSRWAVPLKDDVDSFDSRVDYFSNLGAGLGGDYKYGRNLENAFGVYGVSGAHTLEMTNHHRSKIGRLQVTLDNVYESHNYLVDPNSVSLNTRSLLTYLSRRSTTRLTYNRTSSSSLGFDTTNQSIGLADDRQLAKALKTSLQVNWSNYDTAYTGNPDIKRQEVDINSTVKDDFAKASAELDYQRSIPIGDTNNFYNGSDRTPVLTLKSDAKRLLGNKWQSWFPFTTAISTGQFTDPTRNGQIQRTTFDLNFNKPDGSEHRSRLDLDGRFRQGVYSDNTAEFVLGLDTHYSYRLGRDTSFNIQYNVLRPEGYTPLSIDRTGSTDMASADISFRPLRSVLLGAQTGYDFLQLKTADIPWQTVGVRAEYQPTRNLSIRTLSTYDPYQLGWSNLRADIGYKTGPTFVALGFRYDAVRETMGNANAYITALRYGRLSADARIEYNGYTKQFDAQQYGLVYDLHCAEAVFQISETGYGFNPGRTVMFFLRLKAIPFNSFFGTGQQGQPIGLGTGRDF